MFTSLSLTWKQKRQYDLHGEEGSVAELGSVNVEDLGTVGRLFGALVSKAGIPVPTEITQKVHLISHLYRVGHLLADLGWVDLDLECSTIMLRQ